MGDHLPLPQRPPDPFDAAGQLDQDKLQALRKTEPEVVDKAEASGAQQAFRRVAVLPILLQSLSVTVAEDTCAAIEELTDVLLAKIGEESETEELVTVQ